MIENDLLEIVKKNLPESQVQVISKLCEDSKQLETAQQQLENYKTEVVRLSTRVCDLENKVSLLSSENEMLKKAAYEVEEKERNIAVYVAELQRDEAEKRSDSLFTLVDKVFGNKVIMETVSKDICNSDMYDNNGHCDHVKIGETETRQQEVESK